MTGKPSIATKHGDRGTTRLLSDEEVSKHSPRTDAYGDIDELVSVLGIAKIYASADVSESILHLQRMLFDVASEMACSLDYASRLAKHIDEADVQAMDRDLQVLESVVDWPEGFVLPGGTRAGAHLDHARAVARRCERKAVGLQEQSLLSNMHLIAWLNRLSDYLWLLARREEGSNTVPKD